MRGQNAGAAWRRGPGAEVYPGWRPERVRGGSESDERPASRGDSAIAQVLLCYEVGPTGYGTRRNNQYQIVGTEGSIFFDLDRVELHTGARDERVWELPSWTLPDFKPRDPRRIGNTARQMDDFVAALDAGRAPTITGEDGRKAIEMTQAAKLSAQTGRAVDFPLVGAPDR